MDLLYNEIVIYGWPFLFTAAAPILLYKRKRKEGREIKIQKGIEG